MKPTFHKSARTAIATHFVQEHFQQVPSSPCVDALSVNTRQLLTAADKEETFSSLVLGIKSPQILRQTQMNIQTNEGCLGVPIPWGHLSCTGSHITRICCISAFMSHIEHITCICCICVYIGSGDASESIQNGSHSSFSPLNSTIHGVLFSPFYEKK